MHLLFPWGHQTLIKLGSEIANWPKCQFVPRDFGCQPKTYNVIYYQQQNKLESQINS
jgi:hypothetical protein